MKTKLLEYKEKYTGDQLHSLFSYISEGLSGDSIVAWIGPCEVHFDQMVDGEDLRAGASIRGGEMLHFIVEKFHQQIFAGVCLQRLLTAIALDLLRDMLIAKLSAKKSDTLLGRISEKLNDSSASHVDLNLLPALRRDGDDIFVNDGKLSISIATVSPMSTLIHFALNCTNEGTPEDVETAAFDELGIDPKIYATKLMELFAKEVSEIEFATCKVKWVN
jgi:uncharacterized protein